MELKGKLTIQEMVREGILSRRAHNACGKAGLTSLALIKNYYQSKRHFTNLYYSGEKVNGELVALCENFREENEEETMQMSLQEELMQPAITVQEAEETAEKMYQHLKGGLTRLSNNRLLQYLNGATLNGFFDALNTLPEYRVKQLLNTRLHSGAEITRLRDEMNKKMEILTGHLKKELAGGELMAHVFSPYIPCSPKEPANLFIREYFSHLPTGDFPLVPFVQLMIEQTTVLTTLHRTVFLRLSPWYKASHQNNRESVAEETGYCRENIRLILRRLVKRRTVLNLLDKAISLLQSFDFVTPAQWLLPEGDCHPAPETLVSDTPFTTLFAADLLTLFNPAYEVICLRVNGEDTPMLFSKEICQFLDMASFSIKADELAKADRKKDVYFSLPAFIAPFLKQTLPEDSQRFYSIARLLLAKLYSIFPDAEGDWQMKRTTPLGNKELIYKIIKEKSAPCSVQYIHEQLTLAGVVIEPNRLLERMRATGNLVSISFGIYALREWITEGKIKFGAVAQLAEEYLSDWDVPRHLRDIIHHIKQYRNTTSRSLNAILTYHHKEKFIYFGSGFFGLPDKDYPESSKSFIEIGQKWQHWLRLLNKVENQTMARAAFVGSLCEQYGMQPVQVEFMIDEDIAKGKLQETEDGRIYLAAVIKTA